MTARSSEPPMQLHRPSAVPDKHRIRPAGIRSAGPRKENHDRRRHRRRSPHRRGQAQREASQLACRRPRLRAAQGPGRAQRPRPRPGRRRDHGLRHAGRRAVPQRGPQRRPGRRLSRVGARHHHRPPVRLLPAGPPLRGPGRHRRCLRRGHRRRRRGHDPHPDGLVGRARPGLSLRTPDDAALRRARRPGRPGRGSRAHRRAVGHLPRGPRRVRGAVAPACRPGHRRGALRARDHPGGGQGRRPGRHRRAHHHRRGHPPRLLGRGAGQPQAGLPPGERQGHRGQLLADHRRRLGRADHERGEGDVPRASPPGPASTASRWPAATRSPCSPDPSRPPGRCWRRPS